MAAAPDSSWRSSGRDRGVGNGIEAVAARTALQELHRAASGWR